MNRTTITVNNKKIDLLFGVWSLVRLEEKGFKLNDLKDLNGLQSFDFIAVLIYLAACNANGRSLEAYDDKIGWDFIEEQGMNGKELQKVLKCFTNSLSQDVPTEKKSQTKVVEMKAEK